MIFALVHRHCCIASYPDGYKAKALHAVYAYIVVPPILICQYSMILLLGQVTREANRTRDGGLPMRRYIYTERILKILAHAPM